MISGTFIYVMLAISSITFVLFIFSTPLLPPASAKFTKLLLQHEPYLSDIKPIQDSVVDELLLTMHNQTEMRRQKLLQLIKKNANAFDRNDDVFLSTIQEYNLLPFEKENDFSTDENAPVLLFYVYKRAELFSVFYFKNY